MKTVQKVKHLAVLALVLIAAASCSDDDNNNSGNRQSLLEIAQANPSLTTFLTAADLAGLTPTLDGSQSFTIFAPTNTAFNDYLLENGYASVNAIPVDELKQLLYNHMMNGTIENSQFLTGYQKTLAKGSASTTNNLSLFVNTTIAGGVKFNGVSTIITPDQKGRNGIIHVVDKVIGLPTIVTHIRANPELSTLATALASNNASGFITTLSGNTSAPFTVFAPNNAAFADVLEELEYDALAEVPAADLEKILQYHVVTGNNFLSNTFTNGQTIGTLAGQNVTISLTGGGKKITDVNARASTMTKTDIQTRNGIIHITDKVLLPNL